MYSPPQVAWYLARQRRERIRASLAISGTPVEDATINVAYAGFTVSASGGIGGYRYSIAAGELPDGITLGASSGEVAGTPTESGEFAGIVIRVTDDGANFADLAAFTLTVAP